MTGFGEIDHTDGRTNESTDGGMDQRTDESDFIGPNSASGGGPIQ